MRRPTRIRTKKSRFWKWQHKSKWSWNVSGVSNATKSVWCGPNEAWNMCSIVLRVHRRIPKAKRNGPSVWLSFWRILRPWFWASLIWSVSCSIRILGMKNIELKLWLIFDLIVSCLEKYYSRLIQSIVRILSSQLDGTFDRNNNPLHPIDIKMPWVILHHVLQRDEDLKPISKRKLSTDSQSSETGTDEETDETIPKSIMVFFTAHEYLGNRGWCTKDQGNLLLYALAVCVPRLRTPCLEIHRDIIAEYLEQITYCLYGYPAKRARMKHIEEHDAQNIELTWNHAVQLFDLYRPDELPEYDSYKWVKYTRLNWKQVDFNLVFPWSLETIQSHQNWSNCCSASSYWYHPKSTHPYIAWIWRSSSAAIWAICRSRWIFYHIGQMPFTTCWPIITSKIEIL